MELSTQSASNGTPDAGLSHTRGSNETEYGSLKGALELPHSQILQHPSLQLLHGIVIIIQEHPRRADVQAIWLNTRVKIMQIYTTVQKLGPSNNS